MSKLLVMLIVYILTIFVVFRSSTSFCYCFDRSFVARPRFVLIRPGALAGPDFSDRNCPLSSFRDENGDFR